MPLYSDQSAGVKSHSHVADTLVPDSDYVFIRDGYICVPCCLIFDQHLTDAGLRVLLALHANTRTDQRYTWEYQETTAEKLHRSTDSIGRALSNIKAHPHQIAAIERQKDPETGKYKGNRIDLGKVWLMIDTAKARAKEAKARKAGRTRHSSRAKNLPDPGKTSFSHTADSRRGSKPAPLSKPDTAIPQICGDININNEVVSKYKQQTDSAVRESIPVPERAVPVVVKFIDTLTETERKTTDRVYEAMIKKHGTGCVQRETIAASVKTFGVEAALRHLPRYVKLGRGVGLWFQSMNSEGTATPYRDTKQSGYPARMPRQDIQTPAQSDGGGTERNVTGTTGQQRTETLSGGTMTLQDFKECRARLREEGKPLCVPREKDRFGGRPIRRPQSRYEPLGRSA